MNIKEWVKANAKDGSNFAEFDELLSAYEIPKGVKEAKAYIFKNKELLSAFDDEVRIKNEEHDERFIKTKLPDMLKSEREAIMKELNPEETPERKEIREMREELAKERNEKAFELRKNNLMKKAEQAGFDSSLAAELAVFGDDSEKKLDFFVEKFNTNVNTKYEQMVKGKFGNSAPKLGGGINKGLSNMTQDEVMEYAKTGDAQKAEVLAFLKQPKKG